MFAEVASHTMNAAHQTPAQVNQMYAAARKRSVEAQQPSYMQLMLDRQAPKRVKTEHISTEIYSNFLKQQAQAQAQADIRAKACVAAPGPMPAMDRAGNSLSLTQNSFLIDRMARQTAAATPGLYDNLGLGQLMPGLSNADMAFGGLSNNGGSMLDSTSSAAARQRLGLTGMTAASMMPTNVNTGRSSLSMPSRSGENSLQQSLFLEAATRQRSIPPRNSLSMLASNLSPSDQAFLSGLIDTNGLSSPIGTPSMGMGLQGQFCAKIGSGASPLPALLVRPEEDNRKLSEQQVFLRHQIEVYEATSDDTATHTRGRNKPIRMGQVGIRCKHCAHLPVVQRQKGSTYFPASLLGLYQAAQNMLQTHMQSGICREMPEEVKTKFADFQLNKVTSSGAGRPYWAHSGKKLGLVDTPEDGIRCIARS